RAPRRAVDRRSGGQRRGARRAHARGADAAPGRAGGRGAGRVNACDACLRRAWLVARLSPRINDAWQHRRGALGDVLAVGDAELLAVLARRRRGAGVRAEYEAFDAQAARTHTV